ncbi:TorF family putative porin [Pseudomonas sp.]|uniref:TorF family putative porin n=1 Tax=Pseudomonas sp. TaxID=306 RepID=UPI0027371876|nr:TorF family putative porin [Pseudomonas sp.]MDP2745121.1 TorF family putative porin [Pseudomonas sp.]
MRTLPTVFLSSLVLAPLSCVQAFELNQQFRLDVTPAIVSDYRASGLSQTQGDPAAQLNLVLSHASGLYAGVWTSSVDFGFDSKTRQELEYYAGYYWQISENISLDTYYTRYDFPRESDYNQSDVQALLDVYGVLLGAKYVSNIKGPDAWDEEGNFYKGDKDEDLASFLIGYRTQLPGEVGLEVRYEYVDYKDEVFFRDEEQGRAQYRNWEVKLNRDFVGVTWGLSYIDTDLSKSECASFMGYDDLCGPTLVASASKTF